MQGQASTSWAHIILIYLIGVFGMLVVSSAVPALGGIAREFRPPSSSTIGWVMSVPALAAALSSLLIGGLVDRFGERPLLAVGGVLVVLGDAGVIASGSIGVLLAWRVAAGLGYVCIVVAAVTLVTRLTSGRQRIAALALWSTVIPASFVVSSLYGALATGAIGWRGAFLSHAVGTGLLVAAGLALLPGREGGAPSASRLSGVAAVLRTPWPFVLGLSFAAAAFLQTGFVATLPALLARRIDATESEVHSFTILAMACNIVGAFGFGFLYARGVRTTRLGLGAATLCAMAAAGLILTPIAIVPAMAMDCALMFGLGLLVGMWALMPTVAPSPASIGATSGLITQVTLLGVLFGPPAAFAAMAIGTNGQLLFMGIGCGLSLAAWPIWRRPYRVSGATAH